MAIEYGYNISCDCESDIWFSYGRPDTKKDMTKKKCCFPDGCGKNFKVKKIKKLTIINDVITNEEFV